MAQFTFPEGGPAHLIQLLQNLAASPSENEGAIINPKNGKFGKIRFRKFMSDLGINLPKQGLTEAVSFGSAALIYWLLDDKYKIWLIENVDEIRIFFGIYTEDFLDENGFKDENIGRLTVFLWPYLKGKPATYDYNGIKYEIPAFNLGGLKP